MPDITFDGRKLQVPAGTNLVEAGLQAGVPVPVFCYHRELGAVGSCRVCAVTTTQQGRSRMVMACMTQAADGMEVTTLDPQSIEMRRYVLEWLMENHPHDCPICDEGGECQLQDLTVAAGQGHRRYRAPKRTFANQYLGEFIAHEMNRCIACYRCSRFYQEVAGGRDFGATGSRDRMYFGRFEDGPLESPFSGNLVEFCPTGVFTDKLFRYRARVWDLEQTPSVCPHCSVGCNVRPGARHRELMRVRVRENPEVNGSLLCDRGQFGHRWSEHPQRPRDLRVRGRAADWDEALALAGGGLLAIARAHGAEAIALLASPRASLETHAALRALATGPLDGARLAHFDDPARESRALAQLAALGRAGCAPLDQAAIAQCDALLVAGVSLVDEAPLAALGARAAARNGGRLFVANAGEHFLGDVAEQVLPVHPARLGAWLEALAKLDAGDATTGAIAAALRDAKRPGVLAGGDMIDGRAITALVQLGCGIGGHARLGFVFPGPNGFGAAAARATPGLEDALDALARGALRAAVVVESDLERLSPALVARLAQLELLIVIDHAPGALVEAAHVLLPAATPYENDGTYVNRAGRAQAFVAARAPGESVRDMLHDDLFPRQPRRVPPESDPRPAWWALERLREAALGQPTARTLPQLRGDLARRHPFWAPLGALAPGDTGVVLDPGAIGATAPPVADFAAPAGGALALFHRDRTLGSEPLSSRSHEMAAMAGPPVALISPADALRLGLAPAAEHANGAPARVALTVGGRALELPARVLDTVPDGALIVPRDALAELPAQGAAVEARAMAPAATTGGGAC